MKEPEAMGPKEKFEITKVTAGLAEQLEISVATEVPFTIQANGIELATLMCTPDHLEELTYGFMFTSGFIQGPDEVLSYVLNRRKWKVLVKLARDPEPHILNKRLYTSGCGKGVMYSSISQIAASRSPLKSDFHVGKQQVNEVMKWFRTCSDLHKKTRGVHTGGLSEKGNIPKSTFDDIGRHNAVDKAIGRNLMDGGVFSSCLLLSSGRISSEILHKAKKCNIPVLCSLGTATNQAVLLARTMNITLIGLVRGDGFTVFSHGERITQ